ncbi:unnamed protein product [Gadus morhua 'NCC']
MYKTKARPNKKDFSQLLDLEFQARRAFINSDVSKEQDRPTKTLQAYPCFRELDHLMDELQRILNRGNSHFITEMKTRWGDFYAKAQFYGVFKKVMRPPLLDKVYRRPNTFLQTRPLSSPVIVVCETTCILAIGTMPVLVFAKEDIYDCVMYLMACYYAFHLTYPKCIATLLSVLQTEVLLDAIHDCDTTSSYKKAMAEWKKFTE